MNRETWSALSVTERSRAWSQMDPHTKDQFRSDAGLTPDLVGVEGWRIEARYPDGGTKRYYVSRSTGWQPCHIEVLTTRSMGGGAVYWPEGTTFRRLYKRGARRLYKRGAI